MSDLSHESREVLRNHTAALERLSGVIEDAMFKLDNLGLDITVEQFRDAVDDLREIKK